MRLGQYALLGIGGVRALHALGIDPGVVHLNEGHAAMACLELARAEASNGGSIEDAFEAVRRRTVFTTHTPVPAGNDTYPAAQMAERSGRHRVASSASTRRRSCAAAARTPTRSAEPFGVTQFALRSSRIANGVSARHGEVAREMWQEHVARPRRSRTCRSRHVTNGAHIPTWIGRPMRELLDRHLGDGWTDRAVDPATWEPLDSIPDARAVGRPRGAAARADRRRARAVGDGPARPRRHRPSTSARRSTRSIPDMLTIGFARRVATYKRLDLLLRDVDRALALLGDERARCS